MERSRHEAVSCVETVLSKLIIGKSIRWPINQIFLSLLHVIGICVAVHMSVENEKIFNGAYLVGSAYLRNITGQR